MLLLPFLPFETASSNHPSWFGGKFENFVVFGDSYTDESRLDYFTAHNNTLPPVGVLLPESLDASDGGRVWPRCMYGLFELYDASSALTYEKDVSQYSGAKLYNYAIAGGICGSILCTLLSICCEITHSNDEN